MQQRSISEQEIEFVSGHHRTEYADRDGNRVLLGDPNGRRIKVVVAKDSDPPFIITAAPRGGE